MAHILTALAETRALTRGPTVLLRTTDTPPAETGLLKHLTADCTFSSGENVSFSLRDTQQVCAAQGQLRHVSSPNVQTLGTVPCDQQLARLCGGGRYRLLLRDKTRVPYGDQHGDSRKGSPSVSFLGVRAWDIPISGVEGQAGVRPLPAGPTQGAAKGRLCRTSLSSITGPSSPLRKVRRKSRAAAG